MPSDFHNTNYSRKCVLKTIGEYLPHVSNDNPWKNRKMFLYSLWLKTYSVRLMEFGGESESDIKKKKNQTNNHKAFGKDIQFKLSHSIISKI